MGLDPYRVSAHNTAKASENKIHDDATARRFGFSGGLVGGVHVYAYMTHQPVARWGRAWLERGTGDCRFKEPVYDGDVAEIVAEETGDGLSLNVSATASCALAVLPRCHRRSLHRQWLSSRRRRHRRMMRDRRQMSSHWPSGDGSGCMRCR